MADAQQFLSRLQSAGCDETAAARLMSLHQDGHEEDVLQGLRRLRCHLLEDMHVIARRLDCVDDMIRQQEDTVRERKRGIES